MVHSAYRGLGPLPQRCANPTRTPHSMDSIFPPARPESAWRAGRAGGKIELGYASWIMKRRRSYPPRAGASRHRDTIRTLSAGVVVVRACDHGWRYLLLRAFQYWDFPKGMVEEGEESLEGAIREVEEETTLTRLDFRWGLEYLDTPPYRRGKVARYYVAESPEGEVELPITEELGRAEHDEFRWVDFDEAYAMLSPRVQPILAWAAKKIGPVD